MNTRKEQSAVDGTKQIDDKKSKRPKTGFALRLIQAILFSVATIAIIIGMGIMYHNSHYDSFMLWSQKNFVGSSDSLNNGTVELISDKQYDNWTRLTIDLYYGECKAIVNYYDSVVGKYCEDYYYFSSENTTAKTATFKNDSGEAITFSYIDFEYYSSFEEHNGWLYDVGELFFVVTICAAVFATLTALQFIGTYAGRKHKWGNILSIVMGAITTPCYLIGIFGLIGGVKGKKYLKHIANEQTRETMENEPITVSDTDTPIAKSVFDTDTQIAKSVPVSDQIPDTEQIPTTEQIPDTETASEKYIKPRLSPKAQKAMMIAMIVSYALLMIAGILFSAVGRIGSILVGIGICQEASARAYGIVIGLMMLVGVPSIGYYFAAIAPVKLSKKAKIILTLITTVLILALIAATYMIIYFVEIDVMTIDEYLEDSDVWFVPMSVAFAPTGLMICYLLTLFRINPEKIQTTKPEKIGDGLAAEIKHIFAILIYGIVRLVKGILSFKEKQPEIFISVATILLTWLAFFTAFVFAIICIAVLIGVVVMYFTGIMSWAYIPETKNTNNEQTPTDEYYSQDEYSYVDNYGYVQTIYTDRDGKKARDAGGHYVGEISGDGSEKKFTPADDK